MEQKYIDRIANLATPEECDTFAANAVSLGRKDVLEEIARRKLELRSAHLVEGSQSLRKAYTLAMDVYEDLLSEKHGRTTKAGRLRQMEREGQGVPEIIAGRVLSKNASLGFETLRAANKLEQSFEQIVIDHPGEFSPEVLGAAQARLGVIGEEAFSKGSGAAMNSWLEDIKIALENLGGIAHYDSLYPEVKRIRASELPVSWMEIIRRTIQQNASESDAFLGNDIFYSVKGIGEGVWGLRSHLQLTPPASDYESPADRRLTETYRILRDTDLARKIKALHKNCCQVCGSTIAMWNGAAYSEAHHVKPLGQPHNGPDIAENIIVLCPNHHVMFDYGVMPLEVSDLRTVQGHMVGKVYAEYHNKKIWAPNVDLKGALDE